MLDQTPVALINAAATAGFDGVGLRISNPVTDVHSVTDPSAVQRHALDRGVSIHDVEVHRIGSGDPGPLVERAAAVGATAVLVVSDTRHRSDTIAGVAALVTLANRYSIKVGLEYMAWTDPSGPLDAVAIAMETGCQVVVDVLHHVRVGATADDLRSVVESGTLGWVQVCDAAAAHPTDLIHEARHQRLVPGAGALPLADLLAEVGSEVTISVEVQSDSLLAVGAMERALLLHDATRSLLAAR